MGYERREQMPHTESGIDKLTDKIHGYGDLLLEEASSGDLKGLMRAWAPDFDPSSCKSQTELLGTIAEILAPSAGEGVPRWELIEQERRVLSEHQIRFVFDLADKLGLRLPKDEIFPKELTDTNVLGADMTLIAEGGANKTSIVRRGLLLDLGDKMGISSRIYQLGSGRVIPKYRDDDSDSPEYKIAREISGDFFPKDEKGKERDEITEYELNVASALNHGWEVHQHSRFSVDQISKHFEHDVILSRPDYDKPSIWALQPHEGTLRDGVRTLIGSGIDPLALNVRQYLVVATNGQYRPKSEIQTAIACIEADFEPKKIIAIGDETGQRDEKVYAREIGVLAREIVSFDQALKTAGRNGII